MEKVKQILVSMLMVLMIFGVMGSSVFGATVNDDSTISLKIIHTNDTHSRYTYSVNKTIGFAKLKTIINRENPDLTVDAGDIFHGQSFATIEQGGSIAELMAAVGYDAMAPGNHDFNYGSSRLLELGTAAETKILGANVTYTDSGNPFFNDPYLIKEINVEGKIIKIGVFGLISPDIYSATAPVNVAGLTFGNRETTVATAQELVESLEAQGCDVIVALTHIGDSNGGELMRSDAIAEAVSGIDVIVDGHTHDVENREINGALIVQTGCYSSAVGEVEITLKEDDGQLIEEALATQENEPIAVQAVESTYTVESKVATLTTVAQATDDLIPADETVANLIAAIEAEEEPVKEQVVGNTPVKLGGNTGNIWEDVRLGELNLGRVLADSYLFTTGADIAIENAGGIRAEITPGEITMGQVIDVLPFGNYLITKKVSGTDILSMLETSIEIGVNSQIAKDKNDNSWPSNSGSYLQWGGIKAQYDLSKTKGERVYSAKIGGIDLDPGQIYTVACNNYLSTSNDYPELSSTSEINEYSACDEAFTGYLQGAGNERFLNAINNANITEAKMPQPVPAQQPVKPEQKQSSNNPKTGVRESGLLAVLLEVLLPIWENN